MHNLIKISVLFLCTLMYENMLWLNRQTLSRIKNLWYKFLKTSIGATFEVKTEICKVSLPPLELFNEVNTIKHFMKLSIKKSDIVIMTHLLYRYPSCDFPGYSCKILWSYMSGI